MLAAYLHADQRGGQLLRLHFAAHHCGKQLVALLLAQGFCLIQFFQNRLEGIRLFQLLQRPGQSLFQQTRPLGGQNRFRMELEAADAIRVVTHRHDHAVKVGVDR